MPTNANVIDYPLHPSSDRVGDAGVTRDQLTNLLLESHRKSANATEEIMAIREIGKINGLYEDGKTPSLVINNNYFEKQLDELSDEDLLQLSGGNKNLLALPEPIEGEFEVHDHGAESDELVPREIKLEEV